MFGMGGTEIIVILIVALLFLGPDKLPEAAKKISQGIRDIKKQSRVLQRTIEDDEHIGGAIRDLKSALRGEDEPIRPVKARAIEAAVAVVALPDPATANQGILPEGAASAAAGDAAAHDAAGPSDAPTSHAAAIAATAPAAVIAGEPAGETAPPGAPSANDMPTLRMSALAGEPDDSAPRSSAADDAALAALVRPAPNTIARSMPGAAKPVSTPSAETAAAPSGSSEPKHG